MEREQQPWKNSSVLCCQYHKLYQYRYLTAPWPSEDQWKHTCCVIICWGCSCAKGFNLLWKQACTAWIFWQLASRFSTARPAWNFCHIMCFRVYWDKKCSHYDQRPSCGQRYKERTCGWMCSFHDQRSCFEKTANIFPMVFKFCWNSTFLFPKFCWECNSSCYQWKTNGGYLGMVRFYCHRLNVVEQSQNK